MAQQTKIINKNTSIIMFCCYNVDRNTGRARVCPRAGAIEVAVGRGSRQAIMRKGIGTGGPAIMVSAIGDVL